MHSQLPGSRTDTLEYVHAMLGELRTMTRREHYEMLTYLIEMAYLEAGDMLGEDKTSRPIGRKRNPST